MEEHNFNACSFFLGLVAVYLARGLLHVLGYNPKKPR